MNTIRINILGLALIGAALTALLALMTSGPAQLATLAVAGTLIGGFATSMIRLSEPDPDPSVPASVMPLLLRGALPDPGTAEHAAIFGVPSTPLRANVLILVLIGALIVGCLAFVVGEAALVTVAGGYVGGLVAIAAKLVEPPPNPSVPASVVAHAIEHLPGTIATGPGTRVQEGLTT